MQRLALLGHPVEHSHSPRLFAPLFDTDLLDWSYELIDIASPDAFRQQLAQPDFQGYNVTIPHKRLALELAHQASPRARRIGAANTLYRDSEGQWVAENTDYDGFLAQYNQGLLEWDFKPQLALVLGTGGSAQSVCAVLEDLHIPTLQVSRNPTGSQIAYSDLIEYTQAPCLMVNCTPVGMWPQTQDSPLASLQGIGPSCALIDLIYNPAQTALMQQFQERGLWNRNGALMLEVQAKAAWEHFRRHARLS
jgi:shikimate dehydrogenase